LYTAEASFTFIFGGALLGSYLGVESLEVGSSFNSGSSHLLGMSQKCQNRTSIAVPSPFHSQGEDANKLKPCYY
jgi:hypothetical protein